MKHTTVHLPTLMREVYWEPRIYSPFEEPMNYAINQWSYVGNVTSRLLYDAEVVIETGACVRLLVVKLLLRSTPYLTH